MTEIQEINNARHKPKFDGTVNLGHIFTAVAMLLGGLAVWYNSQISIAKMDARISSMELGIHDLRETTKTLADNQQISLRTQDKIANTIEGLTRKSNQ